MSSTLEVFSWGYFLKTCAFRNMATTVLITGCSPDGLGHAMALEFHRRGCRVIATARRLEVLKDLEEKGIETLQLDVTDAESVEACREETARITGGKLDVLVNNAGRTYFMPLLDDDMDAIKATYDVNVFGMIRMCSSFGHMLMAARGVIVNISSIASGVAWLFASVYTSSKSALESLSRGLRWELEPLGVRVMAVMCGICETNIWSSNPGNLPPGSLYASANDVFCASRTALPSRFSVSVDVVVRKIVAEALKGEGRLGGTRKRIWVGGLASVTRYLGRLRWLHDAVTSYYCQRSRMNELVREANSAKLNKGGSG